MEPDPVRGPRPQSLEDRLIDLRLQFIRPLSSQTGLTLEEDLLLRGTPETPTYCQRWCGYTVVNFKCTLCGRVQR